MDQVVVVNENDEVLEYKERKVVHEQGDWHRGVHVLISNFDGRYLLQRRSEKKDTFPGRWDYSVSEHVNPGENYLETVKRGLSEELGIESSNLKRLAKVKMNYGPQDNMISKVFFAKDSLNPQKINEEEVAEIGYFSKEELDSNTRNNPNKFTRYFLEFYKWHRRRDSDIKIIEDYR